MAWVRCRLLSRLLAKLGGCWAHTVQNDRNGWCRRPVCLFAADCRAFWSLHARVMRGAVETEDGRIQPPRPWPGPG